MSDDWISGIPLEERHRIRTPPRHADPNMTQLKRMGFKEAPPMRTNTPLKFNDLMPDAQTHMLTDYNQDLLHYELNDMLRDIGHNTLAKKVSSIKMNLFLL